MAPVGVIQKDRRWRAARTARFARGGSPDRRFARQDGHMTRFYGLSSALFVLWAAALGGTTISTQQNASPAQASAAPKPKPDEGIPIPNQTVQKACAPCHTVDDKQQISRISFRRNTPEGWQETIRRMVALNGLRIDPQTAREVVKYLANNLGLAPEEAGPAAFEVERRVTDYKYAANADAENVCNKCHSLGRVIAQRRTREEWNLLVAMHRGWYPLVDNQAFRRGGPAPRDPSPDGRPPDTRHPVEKAVDHLARAFPLKTAEWSAWSATMRPARLEGTWAINATELGRGTVFGQMTITAVPNTTDEFTTEFTLIDAGTGERRVRRGQALIYTGFQWRGRSTPAAPTSSATPGSGNGSSGNGGSDGQASAEGDDLREVMSVDRDWRSIQGRWFTGGYDEIGLDVRLQRVGPEPHVLGSERAALRVGSTNQSFRIYGINLPSTLRPADVDFGPGITVTAVSNVTGQEATVTVDVASTAPHGVRDLFIRGSRTRALAVYDNIDSIKVTPAWAMARVGGVGFPKALAQFEAHAYDAGPDNRPDTSDDIDLGMVPATWSLEEFAATYDDDDVKFVGQIDAKTGLFTPNIDGPNPARRGQRNNVGDVYAVATYTPPAVDGKPAKTLRGRAHLLVTVPLYMRWEEPGSPR
jgi:quinohemoprotein amine dehydrogenase